MTALLKGLLYSCLFVLTGSPYIVGQAIIPQSVFDNQGGIELVLESQEILEEVLEHEGIYLDHGCNHHQTKLYVTQEGYEYLIAKNIEFQYLKRPPVRVKMKAPREINNDRGGNCMPVMNFYPTYEGYVEMMYAFEETYPELCEIINIGTLESGRELLVAHIGDRIEVKEDEPNFLYSSTMHGDETAGFPIMLQLIDYLLCNYGMNEQVDLLMNNVNIYINPLANPDGTYTDDNSTVEGATRRNANFIDLNRNFPDPQDGSNPDNRPTQKETQSFIDFSEEYNIHMACNIHGGAEVVSYPWDTWDKVHADESWWIQSCRAYADTAQAYGPANYLTDLENGITKGYNWYEVNGSRQGMMNYFHRSREMSLEISNDKLLNSDLLPEFWQANRASLLNYMNEALYGLRGQVIDCTTGLPVEAEIFIPGHDKDNSSVFSSAEDGNYFRFIDDGTYEVQYLAMGYDTVTRTVIIRDHELHVEGVELCPTISSSEEEPHFTGVNYFVTAGQLVIESVSTKKLSVEVFSSSGKLAFKSDLYKNPINISSLNSGIYFLRLSQEQHQTTYPLAIP